MYLSIKWFLIVVLFLNAHPVLAAMAETTQLACPEFPYFRPTKGPLARVNCDFHKVYEQRVEQIIRTFGVPGGRAVILNLGGTLVLKYNGKTQTISITPPAYQQVKVFAHASFAVFLLLPQNKSGQLLPPIKLGLSHLEQHLQQSVATIPSIKISLKDKATVTQLANLTLDFINRVLTKNSWTAAERAVYFRNVKPLFFRTTKIAARLELSALDQAINPWLAKMSLQEQKNIGIVVATAHQARASEISLQYFAHKFGQQFGEGASLEHGLVVLEDKFDETAALKLLARHYLDRSAAQIIFNDEARLQRDVLADAARTLLR